MVRRLFSFCVLCGENFGFRLFSVSPCLRGGFIAGLLEQDAGSVVQLLFLFPSASFASSAVRLF